MIVETSALVAIFRGEPEADDFLRAIEAAQVCRLSAASYLEIGIVMDGGRSVDLGQRIDDFLAAASIVIEPVTEAQARLARQAYRDFGKGGGHPARLNFGDCFAYALAREKNEPLLFKGEDFARTDVRVASLA